MGFERAWCAIIPVAPTRASFGLRTIIASPPRIRPYGLSSNTLLAIPKQSRLSACSSSASISAMERASPQSRPRSSSR